MSDIESITFAQHRGSVYILHKWPKHIAVSAGLQECSLKGIVFNGDDLMFTCKNGTAEYTKTYEDGRGDWFYRLIHSTYEYQSWPP